MNEKHAVCLLPGLDGTGRLFERIAGKIANFATPVIVSYPTDRCLSSDELTECVLRQLPTVPFLMVAESFSGPVAARVAATAPGALRGVLLSTSFVSPPAPPWLARLPLEVILRIAVSSNLLSHVLLNTKSGDPFAREVVATIRSVPTAVLAARLRQALRDDASNALRSCTAPVAYLAAKEDRVLGWRGLASVQRVLPDIECAIIKGPHLLLQQSAGKAADIIAFYTERWLAS